MEQQSENLEISLEVYKQVIQDELSKLREETLLLKVVNAQLKTNLIKLQKEADKAYLELSRVKSETETAKELKHV